MKYRYRNVKTGQIITTSNRVSGKNWEQVEDTTVQNYQDDTSQDDTFEDGAPDEESAVEEVPVEKPKTTRRGKK